MQEHARRSSQSAGRARLTVLTLLLAGFLSMHGFLAFSTTAQAHTPAPPTTSAHAVEQGVETTDGEPTTSGSGHHAPLDSHDVLTGCIVALVGVALLALGAPSVIRRVSQLLRQLERHAARPPNVAAAASVRVAPPRIALCVIRV